LAWRNGSPKCAEAYNSALIIMQDARISVIIPTYNRRQYLSACLKSVSDQRCRPHEVIVIDDGSTDCTLEAVSGLPGIKTIRQENAGQSAARNRGAKEATGDYLAFLDSDDQWFPWSLDALADLIERHHRPALLFASFEDFSADTIEACEEPAKGREYSDFLSAASDGVFAGAGMMVIKRTIFHAAGGFVEDRLNAEDHDLALRLGTASGFVQVTTPVIVAHRIHDANEMGNLDLTIAGVARLISTEARGGYPGGQLRKAQRQMAISQHVRPVVVAALQSGRQMAALELYRQTFAWNLRALHISFLFAVPVIGLLSVLGLPRRAKGTG
jgi:hypothetical protein